MSSDSNEVPREATGIVSADGKFALLPFDRVINVYDSQTGRRVQHLSGHSDLITGLTLHPFNSFQVISASRDGTIRLWDFADGFIAKQIDTEKPVISLVVPFRQNTAYFQNETDYKNSSSSTRRLDLTNWSVAPELLNAKRHSPLVASKDGELVGMAENRRLLIWSSKDGWKNALRLNHTKNFTCLAIDNTQGRVAGGDVSGRILIWHNLKAGLATAAEGKEAELSNTTVHWHSRAVQCLTFSLDSAYLLSGGSEAVLVAWQLGTNAKRTLPRLSSTLTGICPFRNDAALYLVTQKDNTFRRVNLASMKVESSISGIKPAPKLLPDQEVHVPAVAMLPIGGELVIAGQSAIIQFYDAVKDRHLDKLQVKPVNVFSSPESPEATADWSNIEPQVTQIAFSMDGETMVTLDVRADATTSRSYTTSLKFWDRRVRGVPAPNAPLYHVQTQIDDPHRTKVTGLAFHPSEPMVATIGQDGYLHLWKKIGLNKKVKQWQCTESLSYQGHAMSSVAFSSDGSMVAVGCGTAVPLWSTKTAELVDVLESPFSETKGFHHLVFVPGTPFLAGSVAARRDQLVVWNLLLKAVWWSTQVSVSSLAADGLGTGVIAAGIKPPGGCKQAKASGAVALFNVASPSPLQVWCTPKAWPAALFFPEPSSLLFTKGQEVAPQGTNPLLIITNDRKFSLACRPGTTPPGPEIEDVEMQDIHEQSGLAELSTIANVPARTAGQQPLEQGQQRLDLKAQIADLFDAPTHVLPSIDSLAPAFLELLVCEPSP